MTVAYTTSRGVTRSAAELPNAPRCGRLKNGALSRCSTAIFRDASANMPLSISRRWETVSLCCRDASHLVAQPLEESSSVLSLD